MNEDIVNQAETGIQKLTELQVSLESIESELQSNPKFIEFLRLQDELSARRQMFDSTMKDLMIKHYNETGDKKLEVGNAEFTLTPREELVIEDITKVPSEFINESVTYKLNKEAVKAVQVLEGGLVDGVGVKRSYAYKLKIKGEQ